MMQRVEKKKRPFGVTFLAIYVFCLAAWNALRLGQSIFFWKTLANYGAHPVYIAVSGGVWLIAGLVLAWGLWLGKPWAWAASLGGAAGYGCWYWFDRLVLQKPQSSNWPLALAVTVAILLFVLLPLFSRSTRRFFQRDLHERKPQNPTTA